MSNKSSREMRRASKQNPTELKKAGAYSLRSNRFLCTLALERAERREFSDARLDVTQAATFFGLAKFSSCGSPKNRRQLLLVLACPRFRHAVRVGDIEVGFTVEPQIAREHERD